MRRSTVCRQESMKSVNDLVALLRAPASRAERSLRDLVALLRTPASRAEKSVRDVVALLRAPASRAEKSVRDLAAFIRKPPSRTEEELAFLPAALEIVETPPPPLAGAIGTSIIALFCLALAWACFGHVDIVATASGRIMPSGRTKVIQPFETGVVRAI